MRRPLALAVLGLLALTGPLALSANGQQRVTPPAPPQAGQPGVNMRLITIPNQVPYVREGWEVPGLQMPHLSDGLLAAVHQDDDALKFQVGNELGAFRPAPKGGSAFFGVGRAIFGLTAPPVLPSRILRPLGSGDTGDRFLGSPPAISDTTVIPKIGDTPDLRRHSYAFLGGVPPLAPAAQEGTTQFPLLTAVEADTNGPLPDNRPGGTTPPTTPTTAPPPTTPGTTPATTTPTTTPTTGAPPTTAAPTTTPTSAPPSGTTTTSTPPTTTTTTLPPTTTTTLPPTTTTTLPPTTTTTLPPVTSPPTTAPPNNNNPSTSFVLGNRRESATWCMSNATGASDNPSCDRLFDPSVNGNIQPGVAQRVNLTLWNVSPDSDTDAVALKVFAPQNCTSGTVSGTASGSGNLCDGLRLRIDRYNSLTDRDAATNGTCLVGCSGSGISLSNFRSTYSSFGSGLTISTPFPVNAKVYLVVTALLPDTGRTAGGTGNDNIYLARTASLPLTWQMVSA